MVERRFTILLISLGLQKGHLKIIHQMKGHIFLYLMISDAYVNIKITGKVNFKLISQLLFFEHK